MANRTGRLVVFLCLFTPVVGVSAGVCVAPDFGMDRLLHSCGWHLRLVIYISVFSLNRFAVEPITHFAFSCLSLWGTVTKSIVVLCKCRCRQKQYCDCQLVHDFLPEMRLFSTTQQTPTRLVPIIADRVGSHNSRQTQRSN